MQLVQATGVERARLLSWPRPYPENPYTWRLARALAQRGVTTVTHARLAALCVAPGTARWLHLHWPEWMLREASRARAHARARWFFSLLDAARLRGVRLAWTAHNLVGHDDPHRDLALRWRRALLERCDVVLAHFSNAEKDLRELGFRGRFCWAPHPHVADDYPVPFARDEARTALGWSSNERVFLAFGAIETYKGLDLLARAFLQGARPGMRLHIAGAASSPSALSSLHDVVRGDPRVTIEARRVDRTGVARLCSAADALVLGYREFYTSGVAMLAVSYGLPVVGPARNHLRDWQGRSFFRALACPEDLPSLLEGWEPFGADARVDAENYATECTWERMANTLDEALFAKGETP